MRRVLTAAVLLPALWMLIKWAPPWVFCAVAGVAIARSTWECYTLLERNSARPFKVLGVLASLAVMASFARVGPSFSAALPLLALTVTAMCASQWLRDSPSHMLESSMSTLFPAVFVGVSMSYAVALRTFPDELGEDLLMVLFLCVIATDTAAYYVGSAWGRHRLAPRVSPNKTWEGAVGGVVASVGAALLGHVWFYRHLSWLDAVVLGVLLGLAAIAGDLAESVVKRATGAKDASSLLPGHGGLLDRADSMLFAGPVLYYYYLLFLAGS